MKRKLLFLFSVLLASVVAWAQTATLEPSTNVNAPEKVYVMKSGSGYWMSSYTSPTQSRQKAAAYAFFAVDGMDNAYKIYSLNKQAWLSYTKASGYSNGTNFVKFVPDQASAEPWSAAYVESKQAYQFSPFLNDNNNTVAGKYMQWYGGLNSNPVDNTTTKIGLWQTDAAGDDASAWYLEEVEAPTRVVASLEDLSNDKLYVLKSGRSSSSGNHYLLYHPDAPNHLSSTYGSGHSMDFDISNPNFHFSIYKDGAGKYYFYNIAARKFIGNADANNAAIPLTADVTNPVEIRTSGNSDYGFAFSTNGKGALNAAETTGCHGVVNWTGGYGNFSDLGNLYKIVEVGENESLELGIALTIEAENYFSDNLYSELKAGVTSSEGIASAGVKALVGSLLSDAQGYKKFRVAEYEPYRTVASLQQELKTSSPYNQWENPTGIYLKEGESCVVAVSGIGTDPVGLKIKNWVKNENGSTYSLVNGLNYITATTEGNVFVDYYTDNFESAPNVKVHFINAPVRGYWDKETMTNDDWEKMLEPLNSDSSIIIVRSEHAQLAYPVCAWKQYCPENVDSLMAMYQQVQWAERDMMGLKKYGREAKNRQLYFASTYGFMAATNVGAYCNVGSLGAIMAPDSKKFDFWGVGHEWGHNNQITPGFHWSGCGETTNNIYASWAQIHFTGNPSNLRLEDETSGIDEYSGMRGGRMQTYFEEALRKGVQWQLQDGPDYHGATPNTKTVDGYDYDGNPIGQVTTTSRNYDHFVKLVPFWQLNLWGTLAGKCPEIIPMVIEGIRTTDNYGSVYNTNGKQQVNWMKLACDSAKLNLLPFFEKAGMLKPIDAYIEDYGAGWNKINEEMIANLKSYVASKPYPAFTEEINYINGHNYHIYRDNLKLSVPGTLGEGCEPLVGKVKVDHTKVKNAVAFETYNSAGELIRITMYGLGSDDAHSYTQVLFPTDAAYIKAVGYDGERKEIYRKEEWTDKSCVVECPLFKNKQDVHKGLYVTDDGSLAWGTIEVSNNKFRWLVTKTDAGIIVLKNQGTGTYLAGTGMSEDPVECGFSYLGEGQYNIIVNGVTVHANNHSGGNGSGSNIVTWSGGIGSASAWELNEIMDFSYSFLYEGEEVRTQNVGTRYVGQDYPDITLEVPYGVVTPTKPEGEIPDEVASDGTFCKTIALESSLPFVPAKNYASIKHWYYMTISAHKYHLFYEEGATSMSVNGKISVPSDKKNAYSWAFVGNPFDGFQIVNLEAGEGKILSSSTTMSGTSGSGTYPVLTDTPVQEGYNTYWILTRGNDIGGVTGFFIAQKDNGANCMNFRSPYLAYWTGGKDNGSTFLVTERNFEAELTDLLSQAKEMEAKGGSERIGCYSPASITTLSQVIESVENVAEPTFEDLKALEDAVNGVRYYAPPYVYALKSNSGEAYLSLIELEAGYDGNADNEKSAAQYSATPTYFTLISESNRGYVLKVDNMERYLGQSARYSWNASNTTKTTWVVEPIEDGSDVYHIRKDAVGDNVYLGNIDGTGADGSYKYIYTNQQLNDVTDNPDRLQWLFLPKVQEFSITSAKAATLYTPIALEIPEGVTAKYVKAGDNIGSTGTLWYTKLNGIIPANTAVVLIGEPATYTFTVTKEAGEQVEGNVLFGYAEKTPVTASEHTATGSDGTVYALANKENGVAFYHYVGANYLAGKAYLDVKELSAGTGVRLFNIFDEETETGIVETVNGNAQTGNEEIYDLTGRRVREARNGLYIVNGQRVIR